MKNLSKKIIAIALGGMFLTGIGFSVTEASPLPVDNAPQVQFYDHGDRPNDNPPPPPPKKEKKRHHHNKDRNRVIVGGAMIGAAMNNDF